MWSNRRRFTSYYRHNPRRFNSQNNLTANTWFVESDRRRAERSRERNKIDLSDDWTVPQTVSAASYRDPRTLNASVYDLVRPILPRGNLGMTGIYVYNHYPLTSLRCKAWDLQLCTDLFRLFLFCVSFFVSFHVIPLLPRFSRSSSFSRLLCPCPQTCLTCLHFFILFVCHHQLDCVLSMNSDIDSIIFAAPPSSSHF